MVSSGGIATCGRYHRTVLVPAAALVFAATAVLAAAAQEAGEARLRADRLIDRFIDGEPTTCMYGNVFVDRDTATAAGDTAFYYRDREIYEFRGRVRLTRMSAVLTCRRAVYERQFGAGDFYGDVRMVDGDLVGTGRRGRSEQGGRLLQLTGDALLVTPEYTVRADTVAQDRTSGEGEAFGRVKIMEPGARNLVTGDHAVFDRAGGRAEVDRRPVLTSREQSGGPLVATSGLMRLFRREDRVVMIDTVRIRQGLTLALADTAVAHGRERLVLTGEPRVSLNDASIMTGERIEFHYAGGQLRQVVITGTARVEDSAPDSLAAIYRGLPAFDILEGDSIAIDFENEMVRRSVVIGQARSRYTPLDLTDEVATNDVTGDTIIIHFRDQRVRRVRVLGNAEGTYRFASLASMREAEAEAGRRAREAEEFRAAVDSLQSAADASAETGADLPVYEPDPTAAEAAADDSLFASADSLVPGLDFLGRSQEVRYGAASVTFEMVDRLMTLERSARLNHGTLKLNAGHILLDTESRELYADGEPLVEDSETIAGRRMGYNFKHKTAAVEDGVTTFDEYYYVGDNIRRFDDQTMKICGGRMTSCDLEEPHYHFWSQNMKMRPKDKVVAAPIVLRIGRVPVFALPFYFKSLKQGRQSGILFPSFDFGWSSREGRYIRDWGYYWAMNDYTDLLFEGDYNERRDFGFRVSNRYVKRYAFNGGVDYSRLVRLGEGDDSREWQLRWNHNQPQLLDDYRFRADVKLSSRSLSSNDLSGSSQRDIVSGQLKSSVYLSRNWSFMSSSLNASRDGRVNAEDADPATDNLIYSMTLPSLSLSFRQFTLAPALRAGQRGSFFGDLLRNTYFQQGYSLKRDEKGFELRDEVNTNAQGTWSLSVRPPRVGIFNVSVSANGSQSWRRQTINGREWVADTDSTGHFEDLDEASEETNPSLSFSTSVGTALYGLFPVELGRLRAIRHTVRFNTGWSLSPGLGDKQAHRSSFSFTLNQRFDVKYRAAAGDSAASDKKLDGVLDWNLSTGYNPKLPAGQRWSNISSGLSIKPSQSRFLQLKVNNSIDPKKLALLSTSFTYGFNFSGRLDLGQVQVAEEGRRNRAIERLGVDLAARSDSLQAAAAAREDSLSLGLRADGIAGGEDDAFDDFYRRPGRQQGPSGQDRTEGGRYLPFQTGASLSYSYDNRTGTRRANTNFNLQANLTRNWQLTYSTSYDLSAGLAIRQQFSLNRDLHCWRLEFNRTISTTDSQFGFRLYLKSIPSLKFTRGREDFMGALGGVGGGLY